MLVPLLVALTGSFIVVKTLLRGYRRKRTDRQRYNINRLRDLLLNSHMTYTIRTEDKDVEESDHTHLRESGDGGTPVLV